MVAVDWDTIWTGKRWLKPRRFTYGSLQGWERDLFLTLSQLLPAKGSVLSVGCGRALLDYWLAVVWEADVHLLDLSAVCLQMVRRSFGRVPHQLHCHDALQLQFPDRTFDVVWNAGVWEHFSEAEVYQGIAEMGRVSKGHVVVSVPYAGSRPYVLAKQWLEQHDLWRYGYEDPKQTLRPYFEQAGMTLIEERPIGAERTCINYLKMIPDIKARGAIISQLTKEDFQTFPHLMGVGKVPDQ